MQSKEIRTNQININSLHDYDHGHCGYCDNKKSTSEKYWTTAGFVCPKMSLEVYQSLINKGWRRCGTYYYKADVDKCCCRPYTIRMNVLNYKIRPSHKKALKKFNKFLNPVEKPQNKEKNEPKKEKNEPKKEKIEEENVEDKEFLVFLENIFKKEFIGFINNNTNILKNSLNIHDPAKNFIISEEILANTKFLKSSSKKFQKNHFLTNFLMLFFGKNKDNLGISKMKIEEFIEKNNEFLMNYLKNYFMDKKYKNFSIKCQIQPSGYIFFELCSEILEKIQNKESDKKKFKIEEEKSSKNVHPKPEKIVKIVSKIQEEEKKEEPVKKLDLDMKLQKAQFDQDSFELYQKYCKEIHQKDKESKSGYAKFLCEQALEYESFKSGSEELLCGCYHMKYYLKGKLIAVGVVDILQNCLSSVYFFYDPDPVYKKLGLGIISSIKEIEWIQRKQMKFNDFKYYYLGFYIQSCQKMVYKGEYEPSELLCPITYNWTMLDDKLRELINKNEPSCQISSKDSVLIDEMKFKDEDEILKIIEKKIRITLNDRNVAIKDLKKPYDKTFEKLFKVLIRIWGKKLVDYLYFG